MPVSRMRMRQWLEQKIDSNTVSGLTWMDQERTMFSIPWKHAARHGWELDKDACLFKQWAIHTGKYVEGQTCDPKTWKANFRCAMNSLPDVEEVKGKSVNKGHQAVRVYRMLPSAVKSRDKRSKARQTKQRKRFLVKEEGDSDDCEAQSPSNVEETLSTSTQENRVDSTVQTDNEELPFVPLSEVPEWSLSIEVGGENCSDFHHRFEVSPAHSNDYDTDIIEICRQLEEGSNRLDIGGFLNSDACTSPESSWSDSSSGDDLDDIPKYLTLDSSYMKSFEDIFGGQNFQYFPQL